MLYPVFSLIVLIISFGISSFILEMLITWEITGKDQLVFLLDFGKGLKLHHFFEINHHFSDSDSRIAKILSWWAYKPVLLFSSNVKDCTDLSLLEETLQSNLCSLILLIESSFLEFW